MRRPSQAGASGNRFCVSLPMTNDAANPSAAPRAASRNACAMTNLITRWVSAPRARRTPMSRILDETEYDSMPYTPIAARINAAPANDASSVALKRGLDMAKPILASSVIAS